MIKITMLGTSAGCATKERNVSATAISNPRGKAWQLVDCGDGTALRCAQEGLNLAHLRAIYITHAHADHWLGIAGVLASIKDYVFPSITIMCPTAVKDAVVCSLAAAEITLPMTIRWVDHNAGHLTEPSQFRVESFSLDHRTYCLGYVFRYTHGWNVDVKRLDADGVPRSPVRGAIQRGESGNVVLDNGDIVPASQYRLNKRVAKIVVCGDNADPSRVSPHGIHADVLIHESTHVDATADRADQYKHSTAREVAAAAEMMHVKYLLLTHVSPATRPSTVMEEAREEFKGELSVARDGGTFVLSI